MPRKRRATKVPKFFRLKKSTSERFTEICAEAGARIEAIELERNGRLAEWGLMAKKTAGVPKRLWDAVVYNPEKGMFFLPDPSDAPTEPQSTGEQNDDE